MLADLSRPVHGHLIRPSELDSTLIELWNWYRAHDPIYQSPFYSPHFTQAVGQVRGDSRIAVLERDGQVIGFFPFNLVRGKIAKPIGGQLNDYHGPILAPGTGISPAVLLGAAGISAYDYNHLPACFSILATGAQAFSTSPQMDLSHGYDACVARKDRSWEKASNDMRRTRRKTEREIGPIRFTYDDPSNALFDRHICLRNSLNRKLGNRSSLDSGWVGELLRVIRKKRDPDFTGMLSTLHAGDRLIASHFGIRSGGTWHWWFPAYDLAVANLGPGMALLNECAQAAPGDGVTTIDFGRGDSRYKHLFADRYVDLCEGSFTRQGSFAAGLRRASLTLVSVASQLPLGRFESFPRRAAAHFVSGSGLPA